MSLVPLDTLVQASNGLSFTLTDTTGEYNVNTRPGGYGAGQTPNNKRDYPDITFSFIRVTPLSTDGEESFIFLDQTTAQDTANYTTNVPYSILNTDLGFTTIIGDAVYQVIYYPCFSAIENTQNITKTNGSATLSYVSDDTGLLNLSYILFPGDGSVTADATHHYRVDSIDTDAKTITLDRAYEGATGTVSSTSLRWGYAYTNHVAGLYNITSCIISKISQVTTSTCSCRRGKINNLLEARMLLTSVMANMQCVNYEKAQGQIEYLTDFCGGAQTGGCGC